MSNALNKLTTALLIVMGMVSSAPAESAPAPRELRCENRVDPQGIDQIQPQLSWEMAATAGERGVSQSAYQVLVASSAEKLASGVGDLWDSGKVTSDQSVHVAYAGKPLVSRAQCWWKVRVVDQTGAESAWSSSASWSMGILEAKDWKGQWVGAIDREVDDESGGKGYAALPSDSEVEPKWVQVDLGADVPIERIVLHPAIPIVDEQQPGFPEKTKFRLDVFPEQYRVDVSDDPAFGKFQTVADRKPTPPFVVYFKPRHTTERIDVPGVRARYVRVTATKLWMQRIPGLMQFGFGLGELQVFSGGENVALGKPVTALDSMERQGWGKDQLTDGKGLIDPVADGAGNAAILLRKEVSLARKPVRATAYICGLGYYELSINGKKVGDHVLDPGFTDYSKRVLYVTYDVTNCLMTGNNAIGVTLGNGWYHMATPENFGYERAPWRGPLKLLAEVDLEYADGSRQTIVSDPTWKWSTGPITYNCVRGGETIDARREKPGWDTPGYSDASWLAAKVMPAPAGVLVAQNHPPIRVHEYIHPVSLTEPKPGIFVYDLGVNISGWARFATGGAAGHEVSLDFNEVLNPDGTVDVGHAAYFSFGRFQHGILICSGKPLDTYEPRFTYHGFRYVQVTGLTRKPSLNDLTGCWVTTDPQRTGEFACSNDLINQVLTVYRRTQLDNLEGIPTDCPTREKLGWLEDGTTTQEAAIYNFGMANFYAKWLDDMRDAQDPDGHLGPIVPTAGWGKAMPGDQPGNFSCPWWGGSIVRTPWNLYQYYGDRRTLESAYPSMKRYVNFLTTTAQDSIVRWGLGDWLDESADDGIQRDLSARKMPLEQSSTAAYFYYASIVSKAAAILGNASDAATFNTLAEHIRDRYNHVFLNAATGEYAHDSQSAQSLPLVLGMVPPEEAKLVEDALLRDIDLRKDHINSGIVGTLYVFHALEQMGRDDVAYKMFANPTYPSLPYMIQKGATTFWETWNDQGGMSRNHPALAASVEWLYRGLAGIRPDLAAPGFKHIIIKPAVVGDLTWVKASYHSALGLISSNWKREGNRVTLEITIPPNATATVYVPTSDVPGVREGTSPAAEASGVSPGLADGGAAIYEVGSGHYVFNAKL
jgi:alpha-L-rhamnosidase